MRYIFNNKLLKTNRLGLKNIVFSVLMMLNLSIVSAEDVDFFELSFEQLLQVKITTSSRVEEVLSDAAASVIVITNTQIHQRRYFDLMDLLEDLPSVNITRSNRPGIANTVTIRGVSGNNKILVLQNGMRITPATGEVYPIADNFPLYHAKKVEVLYGPASVVYGADAFSAVINIITENDESNSAKISVSYGQDDAKRGLVNWAGNINSSWYLSGGAYWSQEGNFDYLVDDFSDIFAQEALLNFNGDVIVPANERTYDISANQGQQLYFSLKHESGFSANINFSEQRISTSTGLKPSGSLYSESANIYSRLSSGQLSYQTDITDTLSSTTSIEYNENETLPDSNFATIFSGFNVAYKYAHSDKAIATQIFNWRWQQSDLLIGIEYGDYSFIPRTSDLDHPFNVDQSPESQDFTYPGSDLPVQFFASSYMTKSLFVQSNKKWNERWSSNIGIRLDDSSLYGQSINSRLAVNYKHNKKSVIKLLYSEAFLAPAPDTAFANFGAFAFQNQQGDYVSFFFQAPNITLKPEELRSLELKWDQILSQNLKLTTSLYHTTIDNVSGLSPDEVANQFIPGGVILFTQSWKNQGTAKIHGLDIVLDYQIKYQDLQWNVWSNASWIDGNIAVNSEQRSELPYTTDLSIKLGVSVTGERYFMRAVSRWQDDVNTNELLMNDPSKRESINVASTVDLSGGINISNNFEVVIDITNLFDKRYFHPAGFGPSTLLAYPQPGRRISASLEYHF